MFDPETGARLNQKKRYLNSPNPGFDNTTWGISAGPVSEGRYTCREHHLRLIAATVPRQNSLLRSDAFPPIGDNTKLSLAVPISAWVVNRMQAARAAADVSLGRYPVMSASIRRRGYSLPGAPTASTDDSPRRQQLALWSASSSSVNSNGATVA